MNIYIYMCDIGFIIVLLDSRVSTISLFTFKNLKIIKFECKWYFISYKFENYKCLFLR